MSSERARMCITVWLCGERGSRRTSAACIEALRACRSRSRYNSSSSLIVALLVGERSSPGTSALYVRYTITTKLPISQTNSRYLPLSRA